MTDARRPLVAGNWKMNGLSASVAELNEVTRAVGEAPRAEVLICPPFPLIPAFVEAASGGAVRIGAQDCHFNEKGAHTGDVSAALLKDVGATHVIVGHSERRADHAETSETVKAKATAVRAQGLTAIVCVGETEAERDAGDAEALVAAQMRESLPADADPASLVVAYEPVWAIGTGRTPTVEQIAAMHGALRDALGGAGAAMLILYGGSVKPGNAAEIFALADVDGGLIGGASLKAADFVPIVGAA